MTRPIWGAAIACALAATACGGDGGGATTDAQGGGNPGATHAATGASGPGTGASGPTSSHTSNTGSATGGASTATATGTGTGTGTGGADAMSSSDTSTATGAGGASTATGTATVTATATATSTSTTSTGAGGATGCTVFPSDNPWNTKVTGLPVDPLSDTYIDSIGRTTRLHPDFGTDVHYGIPYNVVDGSVAKVPVVFGTPDESDVGPYPIPANPLIEGAGDTGDRHLLILSPGECKLYELYAARDVSGTWHAGSGAIFNLTSNALRHACWTSSDAAGLPVYPGLVRYDEVAAGLIAHAIRVTVSASQNGWIPPATHQAGSADPSLPPMGLRLRLKSGHIPGGLASPQSLVIMTAMRDYGFLVADNGSSWFFSGAPDPGWDDDGLHDDFLLLKGDDFEVVTTGTILHNSPALCN